MNKNYFSSKRALIYKDIPDEKWDDWRWQLSHRLNSTADFKGVINLTKSEKRALDAGGLFRVDITPYFVSLIDPDDPQNMRAGMRVRVESDDFSLRGAVEGEVLRVSPLEITVHRRTDEFGDVLVHFPRLGYRVTPLA